MCANKKILLMLPKGFEAYEASVFTDVMGWSKVVASTPVKVTTFSRTNEVRAVWNFVVITDLLCEEVNVDDYDALAIPGGFGTAGFYADAYHEEYLDVITQFNQKNKIIATVCVGVLPVAKAGVLKNRNATTYHLVNNGKRRQLADLGVNVLDEHLVVDGNILSCSSPAYALDVAFKLLEMLTTVDNCNLVKEAMGVL